MITAKVRNPDDCLTIELYRAEEEDNRPKPVDLFEPLQRGKVYPHLTAVNPIGSDVWSILVHLAGNPAACSVIAGLVGLWLRERNKRRVELRKGDLKISAPNVKELDAVLNSLDKYKELTITVNTAKTRKPRKRS